MLHAALDQGATLTARTVELLVDSTDDALRMARLLPEARELNAALLPGGEGKTMITPSLGISENDRENLKTLLDEGVDVQAFVTPEDRRVSIAGLI